jgi:GAF domain-containing protein/DNA-binding response OmpR family regulator
MEPIPGPGRDSGEKNRQAQDQRPPSYNSGVHQPTAADGAPGRILVIEDDERVRGFVRECLERAGFAVDEAATSAEGRTRMASLPDLVVLDVDLPDGDGRELCRRLKADPQTGAIPVVMLSGVFTELDDRAQALELGSDAYLTKPIRPSELVATVRAMLRLRHAERQQAERARAEQALQDRVAQAKAMVEVARAVTASLDLQAVLDCIVDQACRLLHAHRFALAILEPSSGAQPAIRFAATRGLSEQFRRLRPRHWRDGTTATAIHERRPVASRDLLNDPAFPVTEATRRIVEAEGYRAVLSVPLLAGERPLGAVVLYRDVPGAFSEEETDLLQVLAAQASIAIQNAELYRRAETRAEKLAALSRLTQRITSSAASGEVFDAVAEVAARLLEARMANVWVNDPEGEVLRVEGAFSLDGAERAPGWRRVVPQGRGIVGTAFVRREPQHVIDVQADGRWLDGDLARLAGLHACAAYPLLTGDQVLGVLSLLFTEPRELTEEEKELLRLLAGQAAIAITRTRLYLEAEGRRREAEVMADLARDINASLDLDSVLERVALGARDLCRADFARIALRVPGSDTMTFRHAIGVRSARWRDHRVEPGQGSGGQVLLTGEPFRTDDCLADPRITGDSRALATDESAVAETVVPIRSPDGIEGLLYVTSRSPRRFTDRDVAILVRLATHAGTAIKNAALFEELRRAHGDLARSQQQLVRSERLRALGEMAAGVAHDFNNVLSVILGRAELLLRRLDDPKLRAWVEAVGQAARDGADTVRRIQEFTRTRTTRAFAPVDLGALLREVVELTRPRWEDEAQSRGVPYDVRVSGAGEAPVAGRPEELREVFINLVVNALEAMPAGGRCELALRRLDDAVEVDVIDTGCGMHEEVRQRVFEPFFTTKDQRGNGLGLALAWGIVTRHGGTIDVSSTVGQGTTFTVRLPLGQGFAGAEEPEMARPPLRTARVLIVDDEPAVRGVLATMLAEAGLTVTEAASGREALGRCAEEPFDLLVSDLSMPGMSGWEVAAVCRERFPHLPVGLITGWGDQLDRGQLERHRVRFVIAKPFETTHVLHEIARALPAPPVEAR